MQHLRMIMCMDVPCHHYVQALATPEHLRQLSLGATHGNWYSVVHNFSINIDSSLCGSCCSQLQTSLFVVLAGMDPTQLMTKSVWYNSNVTPSQFGSAL